MLSVLIVDDQVQARQLIRDPLEGGGIMSKRLVMEKRDLRAITNNPPTLSLCLIRTDWGLSRHFGVSYPDARIIAMTGGTDGVDVPNLLDVATML